MNFSKSLGGQISFISMSSFWLIYIFYEKIIPNKIYDN
ncbi:hypothetical protein MC7420_3235 [Coleofasciculus chthonoplastes PCC 7420]|uniref:Uncharacterized protein n=1 Tax=Coleofasciculus chthonoplastes PCC 7420 TaxID=118168 RepID=B4VZ16_9CYAN|nr:hypothetical protein MC7420_3235 [Coleofasciculus chthonoplastes PCC 7420]